MKLGQDIAPNPEEQSALDVLFSYEQSGKRVFIVGATGSIFKEWYKSVREVQEFQTHVEIIVTARFWRRWARRLQAFGFTREDARVLSVGTFGTDGERTFLGVDKVLTFDKPMVHLFGLKHEQIQAKLDAMKRDLEPPYDEASLPEVILLGED